MTSTETFSQTIAEKRRAFVESFVIRSTAANTGTEWFELLHSLKARAALLGGSEKWARPARHIEVLLNAGRTNREVVVYSLVKFKEAVDFPRV